MACLVDNWIILVKFYFGEEENTIVPWFHLIACRTHSLTLRHFLQMYG
jgi:hypothetical protein